MNKLYALPMNPNGTSDIIIADSHGTVLASMDEALFGCLSAKDFGWDGDSLGNIDVLYYGESVGMVSYDTEHHTWNEETQEEEVDEDRSLVDVIQAGEISDLVQVIEIDIEEALSAVAVSPVSDGSAVIDFLKRHGFKVDELETA